MKKIIVAAAVIFVTGIASVYTSFNNNIQPTSNTIQQSFFNYKKELASGD